LSKLDSMAAREEMKAINFKRQMEGFGEKYFF
jgi:hypothetical protein